MTTILPCRRPVAQFDEVTNDTAKAHDAFCALKGSDFASETAVADFLASAHKVISDYGIPATPSFSNCSSVNSSANTTSATRLDDPFKLRFLLPGSFANLYAELQRLAATDRHLSDLVRDFEHAFNEYVRSNDPTDLKTCIHKANNLAEGLASNTMNYPAKNTLGALCDQIKSWPHEKMKESLKNLYQFSSDFTGVRHAGRPNNCNRALDQKDCVLTCLLLLTFTATSPRKLTPKPFSVRNWQTRRRAPRLQRTDGPDSRSESEDAARHAPAAIRPYHGHP